MACFGPLEIPTCDENGLCWDQKLVKNGSKMCFFSKNDPTAFGLPKQVKCAYFNPIVIHFGPFEVTECFENGLFWGRKMGQNVFSQKQSWTLWSAKTSEMSLF